MKLEVVLCKSPGDPLDVLSLFYKLRDIPLAQRWCQALKHNLEKKKEILDRFVDLGRDLRTAERDLCQAVSTIEEYWPGMMDFDSQKPISQEVLNRLHRRFEDMIGSIDQPRIFYRLAPSHVKKAILDLNHRIHEIEAMHSKNHVPGSSGQIYFELAGVDRFPLEDLDYSYFSMNVSFGDMFLHYTQLGKQIYDVFRDQDQSVSQGNIRPLRYYSGEFNIFFFDCQLEHIRPELINWMTERGMDPQDPKHALGWLIIAKLDVNNAAIAGLTRKETIALISKYSKIREVKIHED